MGIVVSTKSELVVPRSVRRRAGLRSGQKVEFKVSGGVISIVPELPAADDEYTPAKRRVVDERLRQARKGPYYGPFASPDEAISFFRRYVRKHRVRPPGAFS
jgi:bifunctional DNA-binding transcriptional regulator/antitoxin component of YhaV-PrlF toxin-antitoxin module